jgi:hypothetical protein
MLGKNWITSNEVQTWALQYLQRRGLKHPDQEPAQTLYNKLTQVNTLKENTPENREILRKLKGAWSQRKHRNDKKRKKNSNYVFSTDAARMLDRLAGDFQMTKITTLELIISDRLAQENAYTSAKKDDSVYKKHAAIFERHLDQALEELCRYKLLLEDAGIDLRLGKAQYDKIESLARWRKAEAIKELPPRPNSKEKKSKKTTSTVTKRTTTSSAKVTSTTEQPTKKQSEATAETQGPNINPSNATTEAIHVPEHAVTAAPALEDAEKQLQEILTGDHEAKDIPTTDPVVTRASPAHINECHDNDQPAHTADHANNPLDTSQESPPTILSEEQTVTVARKTIKDITLVVRKRPRSGYTQPS